MKEKSDALEMLLKGEIVRCKIKTKRGIFTIRYPLPKDIREIEIEVARMLEGMPESSFSKEQIASFRAYATLDKVVMDAPEWWNNLDSAESCPDDSLIMRLYGRYLRLYKSTQESIVGSGFDGNFEGSQTKGENEVVGD